MKLFTFIFMLCTAYNAFGGNVIYLTNREQLSLRIVSNSLPENESFENYKVSIEDKNNFVEIIFSEFDEDIHNQGGGGEMYVYHVNLKNKTCVLVKKALMR